MKTLVIGGSGFLGSNIVDMLLAAGHRVAVVSRDHDRAGRELPGSVEVIEGDITALDQQALASMLSPFTRLVYAADVDERSGLDFSRLDELLLTETDIDLSASQALLDYGQPDIRPALAATLDSVPDFRPGSGWRRESLDNVGANYLQMPGVSRA